MDTYRVNFYQLAVFAEVVHQGNLTRAAEVFMVSQPVISRIVRTLEREYGADLLARREGRLIPTEAGAAMSAFAQDVLRGQEHTRRVLQELRDTQAGRLRLGVTSSAVELLAPHVAQLLIRHPHADVKVTVDSSDVIAEEVRQLRLDAGIVLDLRTTERAVLSSTLWVEEMVPVIGPTHPLAGDERTVDDWKALVVLVTQTTAHLSFIKENLLPRLPQNFSYTITQCGTPQFVRRLVQDGTGATVLPLATVQDDLASGRLVRLTGLHGPQKNSEIQLLRHARSSELPLLRRFLRIVADSNERTKDAMVPSAI